MSNQYKHVVRIERGEKTIISLSNNVSIGGDKAVIMAGPCAVESQEQVSRLAKIVKEGGADILRGGAYKPRTSPYSFQGLGKEGLVMLREAGDEVGLPIISELMDQRDIADFLEVGVDVLQIGTRNMQNFPLLKELGKIKTPVLLKRGFSCTYDEWMGAAEYILAGGNPNVIFCERGIRTFETGTRNTLDISAIPVMKKLSHLPIIVDPSHSAGRPDLIESLSKASIAAGCDGLIMDVHDRPEEALCDGKQAFPPEAFAPLVSDLRALDMFVRAQ